MDLFEKETASPPADKPLAPLADRLRPETLDEFVGQEHLVGKDRVLRRMIEADEPRSMILWGPPGTGKTSLAMIIARETRAALFAVSAVTAGLADIRKMMEQARINRRNLKRRTILFIDEIHRFNKAQQDALLHSVEDGTVILIGATTENPSFEVIGPLLSRCRVYRLNPLEERHITSLLKRALASGEIPKVKVPDEVVGVLAGLAGGDGRAALNGLELCVRLLPKNTNPKVLTLGMVKEAMQRQIIYDKNGDYHYDIISAFIKSLRGSDPDAAVFWMARMLESGEDPLFVARRMVILASEDIGNADPDALVLANAAYQAVHAVGMPEARIILAQAACYLASAPKSNAAYIAVEEALREVREHAPDPVPMHLRNAPTSLMKKMGYGRGYQYAHDHAGGFIRMQNLPPRLKDRIFYRPARRGREEELKTRLEKWWPKRRKPSFPEADKED
ncbi:MAG TPA: replication-associated recombination protein A [bacterium]|nr:replication-associated recombination protein A [bacterium]